MKEESWREPKTLGLVSGGGKGTKPRYSLSEISGVQEKYQANPGGPDGVGQFVFALWTGGQILLGCCYQGNCLVPWGVCCYMCCFDQQNYGPSTACTNISCVKPGFSIGSTATTYLALGSVNGCGATVFRRIR